MARALQPDTRPFQVNYTVFKQIFKFGLDSAISFVGLPQDLFNKAISAAQATYDKKNQFYKVDCNVNFGLSFTIGKREYSVDVQKLVYHVNDNVCQLLLFQTTNPDINIVLGNPFNQQYCVVYDYSGRIGFAKPL